MDSNFTSFFWIFVYMKGSFIWYTQRYTSLAILSYLIYILSFIFTNKDINFFSWSDFFLSFQVRFLSSIVFLVIVLHAFIGLWTVGTDYLTKIRLPMSAFSSITHRLSGMYVFFITLPMMLYMIDQSISSKASFERLIIDCLLYTSPSPRDRG